MARSIWLALATCLAGGCAAGVPDRQTEISSLHNPAACAPEGERLATLTASTEDLAAAEGSVVLASGGPTVGLELRLAQRITGRCAYSVRGSELNLAALATGEGFEIDETYVIRPNELAPRAVAPDPVPGDRAPVLDGAEFIMAADAYDGSGARRGYIGLWRDLDGWVIASFLAAEDVPASPPRPLMRSTLPILAITYFPSIDTNTGGIHLTQLVDDQTVRIIGYFWDHDDWFD